MAQAPSITLNGTTYLLADLTETAHAQVENVQLVDAEIQRLQRQIAIAQTARNAYVAALATAVGNAPAVPATAPTLN